MGWLSLFVNPWLLGGLALLSAPVIIHILNRRRFLVHDWAAMEFLIRASVINRRRLRFEDLLILILRMLLIALFVFAVARPLVKGLGEWQEDRRLVILDDSFSMGLLAPTGDVFQLARESALNQVQDAIGRGIPVTVELGGAPGHAIGEPGTDDGRDPTGDPPAPATARGVSWDVFRRLREARVGDGRLDLSSRLDRLIEESEAEATALRRSVVLISDFRAVDWLNESEDGLSSAIRAALERAERSDLTDRIGLLLVNVGRGDAPNVAVSGLRITGDHPLAGVPLGIEVEISRHGATAGAAIEGVLEIGEPGPDGFRFTHRIPLPPLAGTGPSERGSVQVEHTFETPGQYLLRASIEHDELLADDEMHAVVTVRRALRVLLVDGDPGADRFAGEAGYLAAALAPRGDLPTGIETRVVSGRVRAEDLEDRDVVFVLNPDRPEDDEVRALRAFLQRGGGIGFFLGNRLQGAMWSQLGASPVQSVTGNGGAEGDTVSLFPAEAGEVQEPASPVRLLPESLEHPAFEVFKGLEGSPLDRALFGRFLDLRPGDGSRVLARYDDVAGTPAIIEAGAGGAKVVIFNTSADRDWSDWPTDPSYFVLAQEFVRHLAPRRDGDHNLEVGQAFHWKVAPGFRYRVITPSGASLPVDAPAGGGVPVELHFDRTREAGFYRVVAEPTFGAVTSSQGGATSTWYACRRSREESRLRPAGESRLAGLLDGLDLNYAMGRNIEVDAFRQEQEGEIWRWLALTAGLVLLLELFVAWWFGRR